MTVACRCSGRGGGGVGCGRPRESALYVAYRSVVKSRYFLLCSMLSRGLGEAFIKLQARTAPIIIDFALLPG